KGPTLVTLPGAPKQSSPPRSKSNPSRLFPGTRWALGFVLATLGVSLAGGFAPLGMSAPAQIAFATLLIAATLWVSEAVPLFVTSFIVLALNLVWLVPALEQTQAPVSPGIYLAPFFSDIILLFLGGFVVSAA